MERLICGRSISQETCFREKKPSRAQRCGQGHVFLEIIPAQFREAFFIKYLVQHWNIPLSIHSYSLATRWIFKEKWAENSVSRHSYSDGYLQRVKRLFNVELGSRSLPFSIVLSIWSVIQIKIRLIREDDFLQINFFFLWKKLIFFPCVDKTTVCLQFGPQKIFGSQSACKVSISNLFRRILCTDDWLTPFTDTILRIDLRPSASITASVTMARFFRWFTRLWVDLIFRGFDHQWQKLHSTFSWFFGLHYGWLKS